MAQKRHKKNIKAGFVYVVTNAAWPGMVKIGMTIRSPEIRISSMGCFPTPFKLEYSAPSHDAVVSEAFAHGLLREHHLGGEWFTVDIPKAKAAVDRATGPGWVEDLIASSG